MKKLVIITALFLFTATINAQNEQIKYNIDNCVSEFSIEKIESTKVGYQFWFADKNFADGKTLKMSVQKMNSFLYLKELQSFISMAKQKLPDQ